jgi:putative transposase
VVKTARALIQSVDLVAYEDLKVRNMVKTITSPSRLMMSLGVCSGVDRILCQSFGVAVIAVAPHYTSVDCSKCSRQVKKTLSTRTHKCVCGCVLDRDHNSGINILVKGLSTVGRQPRPPSEEGETRSCFAFILGINACEENDLYNVRGNQTG